MLEKFLKDIQGVVLAESSQNFLKVFISPVLLCHLHFEVFSIEDLTIINTSQFFSSTEISRIQSLKIYANYEIRQTLSLVKHITKPKRESERRISLLRYCILSDFVLLVSMEKLHFLSKQRVYLRSPSIKLENVTQIGLVELHSI